MEAVALEALNKEIFENVLKNGAKEISGTGCLLVPKELYTKLIDEFIDWSMAIEADRRLKKLDAKYYTEKEVLDSLGITEEQIAAVGDVELE